MCVAVPGTVVSIEGTRAQVDFSGNLVQAQIGLVPVKVGDAVLVHAGCILQVLSDFDRDMLFDLLGEIDALQEEAQA